MSYVLLQCLLYIDTSHPSNGFGDVLGHFRNCQIYLLLLLLLLQGSVASRKVTEKSWNPTSRSWNFFNRWKTIFGMEVMDKTLKIFREKVWAPCYYCYYYYIYYYYCYSCDILEWTVYVLVVNVIVCRSSYQGSSSSRGGGYRGGPPSYRGGREGNADRLVDQLQELVGVLAYVSTSLLLLNNVLMIDLVDDGCQAAINMIVNGSTDRIQ